MKLKKYFVLGIAGAAFAAFGLFTGCKTHADENYIYTAQMEIDRLDTDGDETIDAYKYVVAIEVSESIPSLVVAFPGGTQHDTTCEEDEGDIECFTSTFNIATDELQIGTGEYRIIIDSEVVHSFTVEASHLDNALFPKYAVSVTPATSEVVLNPQTFDWDTSVDGVNGDGWEGYLLNENNDNRNYTDSLNWTTTQVVLDHPALTGSGDNMSINIASFIGYNRSGYYQAYWSVVTISGYTAD